MVWHFRKKLLASRFPFESGAGYIWSGRDTVFDKIYGTFCFWKREPAKEAISTHLAVSSIKSSIFQNSLAYGTVLDINSNLSPLFPYVCLKPDFSVIFVTKLKKVFWHENCYWTEKNDAGFLSIWPGESTICYLLLADNSKPTRALIFPIFRI